MSIIIEQVILPSIINIASSIFLNKMKIIIDGDVTKQMRSLLYTSIEHTLSKKYMDKNIVNNVVDKIINNLQNEDKVETIDLTFFIEQIDNSLKEYSNYNLSKVDIQTKFVIAFIFNIPKYPQLSSVFSAQNHIHILEEINILNNTINHINEKVEKIEDNFHTFLDHVGSDNRISISNFSIDSKNDYLHNLNKPLFLEHVHRDNKYATLRDMFIEPSYQILVHGNTIYSNDNIIHLIDLFSKNKLSEIDEIKNTVKSKNINTLFIKGFPGSGKTSLVSYITYLQSCGLILLGLEFYIIKLSEYLKYGLNNKISNHSMDMLFEYLKINSNITKPLIILDGLDEICSQETSSIYLFCDSLLNSYNCKFIITTRLNYVNYDSTNVLNIQIQGFSLRKANGFIEKYFNIHSRQTELKTKIELIVANICNNGSIDYVIDNLLSMPLIFYMMTVTGIDITLISNLGDLYDNVIRQLEDRDYNENPDNNIQKHTAIIMLSPLKARAIAQELAFEMFRQKTDNININIFDVTKSLNNRSDKYAWADSRIKNEEKEQLEKLFPITFFYKAEKDRVSFSHKTILEYFVSEKIMYEIYNEVNNVQLINHNNVLNFVTNLQNKIFIYKPLTDVIKDFVINRLLKWKDEYKQVIEKLYNIISYFFEYNLYKENFQKNSDIKTDYMGYINILFRTFWFIFTEINKVQMYIDFPFSISATLKNTFYNLSNMRIDPEYECNLKISLKNCNLGKVEYEGMDFSNFILNNTSISVDSNIEHCIFKNMAIEKIDFHSLNLNQSVIRNTTFERCNFTKTNFRYSIIKNTIFSGCKFEEIDFSYTTHLTQFTNCSLKDNEFSFISGIINFSECIIDGIWINSKFKCTYVGCDIKNLNINDGIELSELEISNTKIDLSSYLKLISNTKNKYKPLKSDMNKVYRILGDKEVIISFEELVYIVYSYISNIEMNN